MTLGNLFNCFTEKEPEFQNCCLPTTTQLISDGTGIHTKVSLTPKPMFFILLHFITNNLTTIYNRFSHEVMRSLKYLT